MIKFKEMTYPLAGYFILSNNDKVKSRRLWPNDQFAEGAHEVELNLDNINEVDGITVIDNWLKIETPITKDYGKLKKFLINKVFSNDDQIAIILNADEAEMAAMQEYRKSAGEFAKKLMAKLTNIPDAVEDEKNKTHS